VQDQTKVTSEVENGEGANGAAKRLFIETVRENDLSTVLKIFLVTGAGDNANAGGGETSKSGELLTGGGWDRASDSCCCPGEPGKLNREGESKSELFCFLVKS
jgi:hypothetical protein